METIEGGKLFKGGNYSRKYGILVKEHKQKNELPVRNDNFLPKS